MVTASRTKVLPEREVFLAQPGQMFHRIGTREVAAVCGITQREYRMVMLTPGRGPNPFYASLNTTKWEPVEAVDFYGPADDSGIPEYIVGLPESAMSRAADDADEPLDEPMLNTC